MTCYKDDIIGKRMWFMDKQSCFDGIFTATGWVLCKCKVVAVAFGLT